MTVVIAGGVVGSVTDGGVEQDQGDPQSEHTPLTCLMSPPSYKSLISSSIICFFDQR